MGLRTKGMPVRVLAADDSAVMREMLRRVFAVGRGGDWSALPVMELCGVVRDGEEALEAVIRLRPDVLLLDMEMPRMNGLATLHRLKELAPRLPVILCSAHTERGARVTLEALACGAKDYVLKPGMQRSLAAAEHALAAELLPRIAAVLGLGLGLGDAVRGSVDLAVSGVVGGGGVEMVVVGVSTGGPAALEAMLPGLPRGFVSPVLVVQHMPKLFTRALAERLDRVCRMPVREVCGGERVRAGEIWLAPGDAHLEVGLGGVLRLHQGPTLHGCKPAADYLFRSAAATYGAGVLAVVMTGMGSDGLAGALAVKDAGGVVLAQDEASCAVWGMPGRVVQAGLASAVVPLAGLAGKLMDLAGMGQEVVHGMY